MRKSYYSLVSFLLLILAGLASAAEEGGEFSKAFPDKDWWASVSDYVAKSEYHFSRMEKGTWSAPNRAHKFRVSVANCSVKLNDRRRGDDAWHLSFDLSSWGRGENLEAVCIGPASIEKNELSIARDGLVEWYINSDQGLKQGFTITSAPGNAARGDPLVLEFIYSGTLCASLSEWSGAILFETAGGAVVLRYSDLKVYDHRGSPVHAELGADGNRFRIKVMDHGAEYPLTVDPTFSTYASWSEEGDQAGAVFGYSVSTAGDVDGDGFSEILIGAPYFDNGEADEGKVFVYHYVPSLDDVSDTPCWTAESNHAGAELGFSVSTAGDVNNDGYHDVIIGAPNYGNVEIEEGSAFVWYGGPDGLGDDGTPLNADWTAESNQDFAHLGWAVASCVDTDDNGAADVIVGAPDYDNGQADEGVVFYWRGSGSGLGVGTPTGAYVMLEADQEGAGFGSSVAPAGDVNGDGFDDVIVGAELYDTGGSQGIDAGKAYVYLGAANPVALTDQPAWTFEGERASSYFGRSVFTAGDVNGDGYSDILVGAPRYVSGKVYLFHGSSDGPSDTPDWILFEHDNFYDDTGSSVSTAGDVNGDGYADVLIGAEGYDEQHQSGKNGIVYLYRGAAGGLGDTPTWTYEGSSENDQVGSAVATAGDVNADGFSDFLVGAKGWSNPEVDEGKAFLFKGTALKPNNEDWSVSGDQPSFFGQSVAVVDLVSHVFPQKAVVVGAPLYDNGEVDEGRIFIYKMTSEGLPSTPDLTREINVPGAMFGASVANAGDCTATGSEYLLVGAPGYTNGEAMEGAAFLLYPSSLEILRTIESNEAGAYFGTAVAGGGDANGDGLADVIIGAPDAGPENRGKAFIYYGNHLSYLGGSTDVNANIFKGRDFGASVDMLVDFGINLDIGSKAFSDIVVGDPGFDNHRGAVHVYRGSSSGIVKGYVWTYEGENQWDRFGYSVAYAGDVNGDGFSDMIIGAPNFDLTKSDIGKVYLYLGHEYYYDPTPAWTDWGKVKYAQLGTAVCTAGDMNGDGLADIAAGQSHTWGAVVYLGKSDADLDWYWYQSFGKISSLASGDLNNDGYSDLVCGCSDWSGNVRVAYGNGGTGLGRGPVLRRGFDHHRIRTMGSIHWPSRVRIYGFIRSPLGRDRLTLEYQLKKYHQDPFYPDPITDSSWDTGAPGWGGSEQEFMIYLYNLEVGSTFAWRMRAVSKNPFFPQRRWYSSNLSGQYEPDFVSRHGPEYP